MTGLGSLTSQFSNCRCHPGISRSFDSASISCAARVQNPWLSSLLWWHGTVPVIAIHRGKYHEKAAKPYMQLCNIAGPKAIYQVARAIPWNVLSPAFEVPIYAEQNATCHSESASRRWRRRQRRTDLLLLWRLWSGCTTPLAERRNASGRPL